MKSTWLIWKTINIGTHKDANALKGTMKNSNVKIGTWADDILNQPAFTVAPAETETLLTRISVAGLGFKTGATYKDICQKAVGQTTTINNVEYVVSLCPAEVGPQLRIQYPDQPSGEWIFIAMQPITDTGGDPYVFGVGRDDGGLWLSGDGGSADRFWGGYNEFVFCLSKKK